MKIRVLDRSLVAVAGLIILAMCAGLVAQVFFQVDIANRVMRLLNTENALLKAAIVAACLILLLIGAYCVMVLFRHRRRRDRFILQKMESGELAISLKAMESMVEKCLEQQEEIETQSIRLENQRDGLVIRIRGTVASGVSIPLTVDTLQKQIKQYVTACSGVEVKGIRVQIESSGEEAKNAPFAIDAPAPTPLLQSAEKTEETAAPAAETEPEKKEEPVKAEEAPAAPAKSVAESAMEAVENLKKEYEETTEEEDERPIHQRLFSTPEEPCIMPLPPENLASDTPETENPAEKAETEENGEDIKPAAKEEATAAEPEDVMKTAAQTAKEAAEESLGLYDEMTDSADGLFWKPEKDTSGDQE